ncbi:4-hydroxythreonine-4-phosphate dehydrogenase PdxA [Kangiella taiwanensis]|uniref:4-hydroxythreonine-4-phosphate dehydrogenase n=1 Tax=Kangiella taiwanensis TaxID=1079179 RepID=A0ABP8HU54_9GAMM|nr:4-hydroxythreonine-4-phosphate dehydrogenase PdxA [Kangiella taiwanensis]
MGIARILITAGEPAGIGPEILVKMAQHACNDQLIVCADPSVLKQAAQIAGLPLTLNEFKSEHEAQAHRPGHLWVIPQRVSEPVIFGELNVANAEYVLNTLKVANDLAQHGEVDAILTGPVHKGIINDSGLTFSGHTEFFAERSGCKKVVMMLATDGLRVTLATTHLPLRKVPDAITKELLEDVITIIDAELRSKFAINHPKILVCGLNPHAGENDHLGTEESQIITPTLASLQQKLNATLIGPLPADTAFQPNKIQGVDTVLAMYHDQGLPTLKYKGFGKAVNVTLGLPYIRTSVDHGTGLDIAGNNIADIGSMQYTLQFTQDLIRRKQQP